MDDFDDWLNTAENKDWDFYPEETQACPDLEHWRNHLTFLQTKHPDHYEDITYAQLEVLKRTFPDHADYYSHLEQELITNLSNSMKSNPDFGFDDAQAITGDFLEAQGLTYLLYL